MTEFLTYIKNNYYGTIPSSIIYNKGAVTSDNHWLSGYKDGYSIFYLLLLLIILLKV